MDCGSSGGAVTGHALPRPFDLARRLEPLLLARRHPGRGSPDEALVRSEAEGGKRDTCVSNRSEGKRCVRALDHRPRRAPAISHRSRNSFGYIDDH
jgi:hypothetical protein